jgi:hypothetical protein
MSDSAVRPLAVPAPNLGLRERLRLAAEILRAYGTVRRLSRSMKLPAVVAALRASAPVVGLPLPEPQVDGRRLGSAVMRALVVTPGGTRCLLRSLVLLRLLARRGTTGQLIIAVLPGAAVLEAHAWIEHDGTALLPPGEEHERLLVL